MIHPPKLPARLLGCALLVLLAAGGVPAVPSAAAQERTEFTRSFIDTTLRIDYYQTGDANGQVVTLDRVVRQGSWAGNPQKLIDPFGYGHYTVKLLDTAGSHLLYARGYDTYFDEYQTTGQAARGARRTYQSSVLVPCPRFPVQLVLEAKDKRNQFQTIFSARLDPGDYHIIRDRPSTADSVFRILQSGDPHTMLDIVFVAEGYTGTEAAVFKADLERFTSVLLSLEPYRSSRARLNISGVFRPSAESGTDEPRQGVFRNTVLGSSFNALDTDRYLLTEENRTLREIASAVPYDVLCIMVNSARYGGGGLYNDYTIFTTHNAYSETVFLHEFGHGFAGLGDEYYASDVAYVDFYPAGVEPVEPNLTALLDPAQLKWGDLVTPGLRIPTEWGKAEYDSLQNALAHLPRGRDAARVDAMRRRVSAILTNPSLQGKVGAFEGAGYTMRGLYRPSVNCMMFSNEEKRLCPVCERAVARMIAHFAD